MEVNGDYKFKSTQDKVWNILMDKAALQKALPGCERFEQVGDNEYEVTMKIGVASIKGTYNGKISMADFQEPSHYILKVEGAGGQGFLTGEGIFDLSEEGEGDKLRTVVKYKGTANVGGTLAGIGARMLQPVAKMMAGNFFKAMEKQLNEPESGSGETQNESKSEAETEVQPS
jgi:carbon monoxide dehydrogenase subunit G